MKRNNISERKRRRTSQEIEEAVFLATEKLVKEKGFNNVAFTEIMKLAEVEPQVMYRRFSNIEDLYDKFIRRYDYWLLDLAEYRLDENDPIASMKNVLIGLATSLYENQVMQKILVWEVSDNNKLTSRNALNREIHTLPVLDFFRKNMPPGVNFNIFTSLLIGGIYHLILRRDRSSFCGIDFNTDKGKSILVDGVTQVIDAVYAQKSNSDETVAIAQRLLKQGVDEEIVVQSTKLSKQVINGLKQAM